MARKNTWFQIKAAAPGAVEIAVRGYIGEWDLTDRDFIAGLDALGEVTDITVRINSRGGEVDHALSIFNALKSHPAKITCRIEGVAMSAASIIAMAGDEIIMPANTMMMIHNPWTYAQGDANELREVADVLDKFGQLLLTTYTDRTGKSAEEIQILLDEETYMTAAEAVELGFADVVEPISRMEQPSQARAMAAALGIPEDVLARMAAAFDADPELANEESDPKNDDPAPTASRTRQIQARAAELGIEAHAAPITLDGTLTTLASAFAALADAREIVDLCAMAAMPERAEPLIRNRATVAVARKTLIDARAEQDEASHTDSHQKTPPATTKASADVWAKVIPNRQTKE